LNGIVRALHQACIHGRCSCSETAVGVLTAEESAHFGFIEGGSDLLDNNLAANKVASCLILIIRNSGIDGFQVFIGVHTSCPVGQIFLIQGAEANELFCKVQFARILHRTQPSAAPLIGQRSFNNSPVTLGGAGAICGSGVGIQNIGKTPGGEEVAEDLLGIAFGILQSVIHAGEPAFLPLRRAGFVAIVAEDLDGLNHLFNHRING